MHEFLPVTAQEMKDRGWEQVDFVYVSGDAYVDHPTFGHAIITKLLESRPNRDGINAQPDWKKKETDSPNNSRLRRCIKLSNPI